MALNAIFAALSSRNLSQSAIGQWDWGFHTLRDGIILGELPLRAQIVGVVEIIKGLRPADGN